MRIFEHHKKNKWRSRFESVHMWLRNRCAKAAIVEAGGVPVSLTTFGPRISSVYIAIESIGRGSIRPGELLLWMDDKHRDEPLPRTLRRLVARGLSVRYCEDMGPHKKYYPFIASHSDFAQPLVTADDDVIYPTFWLQALIAAHRQDPASIHCFRAHRVTLAGDGLAPYASWPPCTSSAPDPRNFATGVSGVLYPPAFLHILKQQGSRFKQCCPMADDIWLNVNALRHGFAVKQIGAQPLHFAEIRSTRQVALHRSNVLSGGNDRQLAATYTAEDLNRLTGAAPGAARTGQS